MSDLKKFFYLVNTGTALTAYRLEDNSPWFVIEARHCAGHTAEEKSVAFAEVVKFQKTAFGPLAELRELRAPTLPGISL